MATRTDVLEGPLWAARNWSADAGEGSIHDDETAAELGFRGGTVAGNIHMNQFVPVLLEIFGPDWFTRGNLSLNFKFATVDLEKVQVFAEQRKPGEDQVRVWMERDDGTLICTGTAAVGDLGKSELRTRDLRPCDPSQLRILKDVHAGLSLGSYDIDAPSKLQFERYDGGVISDPIKDWREPTDFDGVIAAPATYVEFLWGPPMAGLRARVGEAVGLFGAIEVATVNGPFLLDRPYTVKSEVVSVGQSPQTEYVWFDSSALDPSGLEIVNFRMMLRFMKASSELYQ